MRLSWRWLPATALLCIVTTTTAGQTAANNVPGTRAEHDTRAITPDDLKPDACADISLTAKRSGQGAIDGTNADELITGSGADDDIDGRQGDDCIVGGAGNDSLRGSQGTDVCIGGAGTDSMHPSCEVQIQ
jgi:Ca2+-binding RTX toxin-like protein